MTVLVVVKHYENISRLLHGTESKFSFKKSVKAPEDAPVEAEFTEADESAAAPQKRKKKANPSRHYGKKKK